MATNINAKKKILFATVKDTKPNQNRFPISSPKISISKPTEYTKPSQFTFKSPINDYTQMTASSSNQLLRNDSLEINCQNESLQVLPGYSPAMGPTAALKGQPQKAPKKMMGFLPPVEEIKEKEETFSSSNKLENDLSFLKKKKLIVEKKEAMAFLESKNDNGLQQSFCSESSEEEMRKRRRRRRGRGLCGLRSLLGPPLMMRWKRSL